MAEAVDLRIRKRLTSVRPKESVARFHDNPRFIPYQRSERSGQQPMKSCALAAGYLWERF
jgi:hypothetical protein